MLQSMEELQARLSKLLDDANDCDLIGNLAADQRKRASFRRMARELREAAARLRSDIAAHEAHAQQGRCGQRNFH